MWSSSAHGSSVPVLETCCSSAIQQVGAPRVSFCWPVWLTPVVPELGRQRQEDHILCASQGYILRHCLKRRVFFRNVIHSGAEESESCLDGLSYCAAPPTQVCTRAWESSRVKTDPAPGFALSWMKTSVGCTVSVVGEKQRAQPITKFKGWWRGHGLCCISMAEHLHLQSAKGDREAALPAYSPKFAFL